MILPRKDAPVMSKQRFGLVMARAEDLNAAELLLSAEDWYALLDCLPNQSRAHSLDQQGEKVEVRRRVFRPKPSAMPPKGIYDISGEEPVKIAD